MNPSIVHGGSALWPIQTGLLQILQTDPVLVNMSKGIFDGTIPPGEEEHFPYVVIGEVDEVPADLQHVSGRQCSQTVHVYSGYQGAKEAKLLGNRIVLLVDNHPERFITEGWHIAQARLEFSQMLVEEDEIRHLAIRFRILAHARR